MVFICFSFSLAKSYSILRVCFPKANFLTAVNLKIYCEECLNEDREKISECLCLMIEK